jgi:hypothetical protein
MMSDQWSKVDCKWSVLKNTEFTLKFKRIISRISLSTKSEKFSSRNHNANLTKPVLC